MRIVGKVSGSKQVNSIKIVVGKIRRYKSDQLVHRFLIEVGSETHEYNKIKKILKQWNLATGKHISRVELGLILGEVERILVSRSIETEGLDKAVILHLEKKNENLLGGLQKITMALGSFDVSLKFFNKGAETAIQNAQNSNEPFYLENGIRAAIAITKIDEAKNLFHKLCAVEKYKTTNFLNLVGIYLHNCGYEISSQYLKISFTENGFDKFVLNKRIALVGPVSTTGIDESVDLTGLLVARRIGLGASTFSDRDTFGGKCDIAYTDKTFMNGYVQLKEDINKFQFISLNYDEDNTGNIAKLRIARNPNPLFYRGGANKVPLMLFDILFGNPIEIKIYGTSFFASPVMYSEEYRDLDNNFRRISIRGTTTPFSMTAALAEHNAFTNRNFVKNMLRNKKIHADEFTRRILSLTDSDYAEELRKYAF